MTRFAVLAGIALLTAGGCSGSGMNHPLKKYTKEQHIAANALRGYTEITRDKVIYVASSPQAVRRIQMGKEPVLKVAAIGFGPNGEKVVFEASKDGMEHGLMQEFERRHNTASTAS